MIKIGKRKKLSLLNVYDLLVKDVFVKEQGMWYQDGRHQYLMTKIEVEVRSLGKVILATAYSDKWKSKKAVPVLFLTEKQVQTLRQNSIHFWVKKLKREKTEYIYFRPVGRRLLERIDAL